MLAKTIGSSGFRITSAATDIVKTAFSMIVLASDQQFRVDNCGVERKI